MKKKLLAVLAAIGMMTMSLTGCGDGEVKGDETSTGTQAEQKDTVVASSVAVVQILDALGVEMAGVPTSSYELPESVKDATRIGNPMAPDIVRHNRSRIIFC